MNTLRLAWRYVIYHRVKSIAMIASIALTVSLPIAIHLLLTQFNEQIGARSKSTPVVVGAKGSRLDLTLSALYLENKCDAQIAYGEVKEIRKTGYGKAIPISLGFTAQDFSIVGTRLDYFELRDLDFASGSAFRRLGDCVIGAEVARILEVGVGDEIKSDRTNSLDIASTPPLYMRVTGVLKRTKTADDKAVFVDLKTSWLLAGLGHGHEDLADESGIKILGRDGKTTIASAAVVSEMRITEKNLDSFHFHGDDTDFPITAVIVVPTGDAQRSKNLLESRYLQPDFQTQLVEPQTVVEELMGLVFRAKQFFDANAIIISMGTFLLLVMVIVLSLKLREREMETMFKIGCSRTTIIKLQCAELLIIGFASAILIGIIVAAVSMTAGEIVQSLLIRG